MVPVVIGGLALVLLHGAGVGAPLGVHADERHQGLVGETAEA